MQGEMNMNKSMILLATLLMFGFSFAATTCPTKCTTIPEGCEIPCALNGVRDLLCSVLPIVIMLAIVVAAILYAIGQLGSAESRAKFHGWATNIVIGAITALIVLLLVPYLLGMLLPTGMAALTNCGT